MPIAVLSPAKTLIETPETAVELTEPPFAADRQELLEACSKLQRNDVKNLMSLSDSLAALNYDRFQSFESQPVLPAAWAFDGPAHKALNIRSLDPDGQAYADAAIVTLSGLYGCLRPRDAIRPYRLEMGTKLATGRGANLYAFWGARIARELRSRLEALPEEKGRFLVNVASEEYWKSVGAHAAGELGNAAPVYTVKFPGPSVYAKQARGLFCRFLCERRVATPEGLAAFAEWTRDSPAATALYALEPPNPKDGARALAFRRAGGKEEEAGAGVAEAKATAKRGPAKGKKAAAQGESPAAVEEGSAPAKARTKRATGVPKATPQAKRGKK